MNRAITYNLLNLPAIVNQPSGTATLATDTYDSTVAKLRNTGNNGCRDYGDGIVYKGMTASKVTINYVITPVGRATPLAGISQIQSIKQDF